MLFATTKLLLIDCDFVLFSFNLVIFASEFIRMTNRIFVYNPTCEMAVANGLAGYCPPKRLQVFESELASLLMFAAEQGDAVVAEPLDDELVSVLTTLSAPMPQFMSQEQARQMLRSGNYTLQPWGSSKSVFHTYGVDNDFGDAQRMLHSRLSSVEIERHCISDDAFFVNANPQIIRSMGDFARAQEMFSGQFVVKSLWSSSGRGVVKTDSFPEHEYYERWAAARLRADGAFVVEPLLSKVSDVAFLYYIDDDATVSFLGYNVFASDSAGRFGRELIHQYDKSLSEWLSNYIQQIVDVHANALINSGINKKYRGYLGFDSMLFRDETGALKFRPCVECNLRMTMGNVNIGVSKFFAPNTCAWWQIGSYCAENEWNNFACAESAKHPLVIENGKIVSGFFRLSALGVNRSFGAFGYAEM